MMAGKRLSLPKAKAVKALHPVEALAEGASTGAAESVASTESSEYTETATSQESSESSVLAEEPQVAEHSELLEIAEALESTAAAASIESTTSREAPEVVERPASSASRRPRPITPTPALSEQVDKAAIEVLGRPPDAPTVGHYRRSFMLDPETLALIDELRWHLRCDKSEVVRRAVDLLAREAGLREKVP